MATTITFQGNTAYNAAAAALKGAQASTGNAQALLIQPATTDAYDGTMTLQFTMDDGTTWFAVPLYDMTSAIGTAVYSVASPVSTKVYVAAVPSNVQVRVLMAGGSVGHLTVIGQLTSFFAP